MNNLLLKIHTYIQGEITKINHYSDFESHTDIDTYDDNDKKNTIQNNTYTNKPTYNDTYNDTQTDNDINGNNDIFFHISPYTKKLHDVIVIVALTGAFVVVITVVLRFVGEAVLRLLEPLAELSERIAYNSLQIAKNIGVLILCAIGAYLVFKLIKSYLFDNQEIE